MTLLLLPFCAYRVWIFFRTHICTLYCHYCMCCKFLSVCFSPFEVALGKVSAHPIRMYTHCFTFMIPLFTYITCSCNLKPPNTIHSSCVVEVCHADWRTAASWKKWSNKLVIASSSYSRYITGKTLVEVNKGSHLW